MRKRDLIAPAGMGEGFFAREFKADFIDADIRRSVLAGRLLKVEEEQLQFLHPPRE
jgi:hypothetical protein